MTAHSPGPWLTDTKIVRSCNSDSDIARVYCHSQSDESYIANAHLIAAAPELLAALEKCLEYIPGSEVRSWPPGFKLKEDSLRMARSAIAKAKGGQ
jgi:hypothetical protein